jgi:hypothetical protein
MSLKALIDHLKLQNDALNPAGLMNQTLLARFTAQ